MNIHLNLYPTNEIWTHFSKSNILLLTDLQKKIGMIGVAILGLVSLCMIGQLIKRCWMKVDINDSATAQKVNLVNKNEVKPIIKRHQLDESSETDESEDGSDPKLKSSTVNVNIAAKPSSFDRETHFENDDDDLQSELATPKAIATTKPKKKVFSTQKKSADNDAQLKPVTPKVVRFSEGVELLPNIDKNDYLTPVRTQTPGFEKKLFAKMDEAFKSSNSDESILNETDYRIEFVLTPKGRGIYNSYKKNKEVKEEVDLNISQFQFLDLSQLLMLETSMPLTPDKKDLINRIDEMIASEKSEDLKQMLLELREAELQSIKEYEDLLNFS